MHQQIAPCFWNFARFLTAAFYASSQELYGNVVAGRLLSGFSRLFTAFLQVSAMLHKQRVRH